MTTTESKIWASTDGKTSDNYLSQHAPYSDELTEDELLVRISLWKSVHPSLPDGKRMVYLLPDVPPRARHDAPLEDFSSQRDTAGTRQPRLTGPIMFVIILLRTWRLEQADAIPLLGLEKSDISYAEDLLSGRVALRGRDIKDRIAYLFRIRKTLSALFRDEEVENEWLREPHDALDGQNPIDLLLEGSMENLLLVKEYVEAAAGR